jgi:phospholipase C
VGKTALIVSYDENGGFFDHVPPPVPPPGTPGEYVTAPLAGVSEAEGITGPIGLGFRVPCLVISPFFDFARAPQDSRPAIPNPDLEAVKALIEGNVNILLGFFDRGRVYPVPPNSMPIQETTPARGAPRSR